MFDTSRDILRAVRGWSGEHVLVDRGGVGLRLDVIEGTVSAGPVALHFDLPDDDRLEHRVATVRALSGKKSIGCRHQQIAGRLRALQAADARTAGASLREIADGLLGIGDWPGDGEHRKSAVRRLVTTGERLIQQGPLPILKG